MSENTARRYRNGAPAKSARPPRTYRTRVDPFEAVWPEVEKMLEAAPGLEAKTIFARLQERPGSTFADGQLRTLQRKIKRWRTEHGPQKEVMFPQVHRPGEYAQSDFTSMNDLRITIEGESFDHLVYHFVLPYSQWETGMGCFSESFETLIGGFQRAVGELGRVPHKHRTDNLLPGGTLAAAQLHVARTVCRRAERCVVALHDESPATLSTVAYLNRLSDYLFVAARFANRRAGEADVQWKR